MSERLLLPREWTQRSIAPVWKAAAIAGWAIALVLAQCVVMMLAWPGLGRPPVPPPAELPPPPPLAPKTHSDLEVSNSMARIRCLVAVGRSQEAMAETIRCLTLCQRLEIDPPAELPELFAQTVTSMSAHSPARPPAPRPARREVEPPPARHQVEGPPPVQPLDEPGSLCAVPGRMPGPGYPQASPRPRLAQWPPQEPYPMMPPPPPPMENGPAYPQPVAGRYEFQPRPPQGAPPMPPGSLPGY